MESREVIRTTSLFVALALGTNACANTTSGHAAKLQKPLVACSPTELKLTSVAVTGTEKNGDVVLVNKGQCTDINNLKTGMSLPAGIAPEEIFSISCYFPPKAYFKALRGDGSVVGVEMDVHEADSLEQNPSFQQLQDCDAVNALPTPIAT